MYVQRRRCFKMSSRFAIAWLSLTSIICTWDLLFVLLRPRSAPGGDLHFIWKPYGLYMWVDKSYGDMEDTFVVAQSWLNIIEVVFNLVTVTLYLKNNRGALLCGFFVSTLTFWKTTLYMLQFTSLCNGQYRLEHLDWNQFLFLFLIPNGVWIVVPFCFVVYYGMKLNYIISNFKDKKQ